jgi:dTDP-4-dehydrorhamnose reductase
MERLELWGGIECTLNRVGDRYISQIERSGHAARIGDLDRVAALGIRAMRYPVLWEYVAPEGLARANWKWADERLQRLRELGVTPILGLVHHGSGPRHTSLVDPDFAHKLAVYAGAVARRYPWAEWYTPVNEPLTTARFSGLYGVWYPHARDEGSFKNALLQQCRGIVLAMQAIRRVNPRARLLQTDDLGKTYSTPLLDYQAQHNNHCRWLAWDLLCGRVNRRHALWKWLTRTCGATARELDWFTAHPCPPDIIGVNHYVTSERYLDESVASYPPRYRGGNGRHAYVDIEAARALETPPDGLERLLHEAWDRYRLPMAITEAHIDSTRDDQLRWLHEMWTTAEQVRREGVDLRAMTAWALLGSYDWNCLVTECRGYYESGAYDVRSGQPRATAIAQLLLQFAAGAAPDHPVLQGPGWWKRPDRYFGPPARIRVAASDRQAAIQAHGPTTMRPILITGATGTLGNAFARICERRGLAYCLLSRADMDIADTSSIERALDAHQPWAVVNAAGYVRVDDAENDIERCYRENTVGPGTLAGVCARHRMPLATFSSDLVFDGERNEPYVEADAVAPLNVYGRSKAEAELRVLERHPEALVIRTSAFFGPWDAHNFVTQALHALLAGNSFIAANDLTITPTYVPDLVNACLDLLIDRESGILHLSNGEAVTWAALASQAAATAGVDASRLECRSSRELQLAARRPRYSALGTARAGILPTLTDALRRYAGDARAALQT